MLLFEKMQIPQLHSAFCTPAAFPLQKIFLASSLKRYNKNAHLELYLLICSCNFQLHLSHHMTDNCSKNPSYCFLCLPTYIPKVERQELCPAAPLLPFLDTDWGRITSSTIWLCSGLGLWQVKHTNTSNHAGLHRNEVTGVFTGSLARGSLQPPKPSSCGYCHTPLETPPRWNLQKQLLPSCQALCKLESQPLIFFSHPHSHLTAPSCGAANTRHWIHCSLLIMVFTGV